MSGSNKKRQLGFISWQCEQTLYMSLTCALSAALCQMHTVHADSDTCPPVASVQDSASALPPLYPSSPQPGCWPLRSAAASPSPPPLPRGGWQSSGRLRGNGYGRASVTGGRHCNEKKKKGPIMVYKLKHDLCPIVRREKRSGCCNFISILEDS